MEFVESFMKFSFPDDDCFRIEKDPINTRITGKKSCECIVFINPKTALIEAKASTPNPSKSPEELKDFIDDIKQKFADSLALFNDIKNKKFGDDSFQRLPKTLREIKISSDSYLICLIIHGHEVEWLPGLTDFLKDGLRDVIKQWNLKDANVKAYNEETAKANKLIVAYIPKEQIGSLKKQDRTPDEEKIKQWFVTNVDNK